MRLPQCEMFKNSVAFLIVVALPGLMAARGHASTQQLTCSPTNLSFGAIQVGQSETEAVTVTNAGTTSATISAISASGSGFSATGLQLPATVSPGQSVSLFVSVAPTASGWDTGNITLTSNASNPTLQIGLQANAVKSDPLTAAPSTVSFGQVNVGSNGTQSVVVTNAHAGKVTLTAYQVAGTGFTVSGPALPVVLSRGQSITLTGTFTPQSAGTFNGSIFLPGPGLTIPLTGTGASVTGQLTVSPASLSFGSVNIGSTTTQPSTISAAGGSVTLSSASSSSSQFSISGLSLPFTLNSGQSAQVNVVYAPSTAGSTSATLTFTTSTSSKSTESLSGTGVTPQYSVDLSWNPSTSSVSGYNVYRGLVAGSYTKINSGLDPGTTYTDSTVSAGTTYYYAATAVDSSGQESTYSTPVQVVVP
jgi:HYDIN/CFA65/VesB family protein/ASPM-SPD-2-Hydin domain-containing protein